MTAKKETYAIRRCIGRDIQTKTALLEIPPFQQAVPPELAESLPTSWPFGVPDDDPSEKVSVRTEAEEDSGGEGPAASSISPKQDDIAQHAVDALNEADQLNRGQSFRIVPGAGQMATEGASPTPAPGSSSSWASAAVAAVDGSGGSGKGSGSGSGNGFTVGRRRLSLRGYFGGSRANIVDEAVEEEGGDNGCEA